MPELADRKPAGMGEVLSAFAPISLEEMLSVRLMNRMDTKFVTSRDKAMQLLCLASDDYFIQEIDGRRVGDYYTVYFDTPLYDMFRRHESGKVNRQKLRIRSYVDTRMSFLEVKTKDNHLRTKKKRISMPGFDPLSPRYDIRFSGEEELLRACEEFVEAHLHYDIRSLSECIENRFHRITLVNKEKTERLTIDLDVAFHNLTNDRRYALDNVAIIELKRDSLRFSPILALLKQLRIKRLGFSKYCMGTAITYPELPQNRIKGRLRSIKKLQEKN